MLRIRPEQMRKMQSAMTASFDAGTEAWVRSQCAAEFESLPPSEQAAFACLARKTASSFGLSTKDRVHRFAECMLYHGVGFHELPWAVGILFQASLSPDAKLTALESGPQAQS